MSELAMHVLIDQTGHPGIDAQHQQLSLLVADLNDICADAERAVGDCPHCPEAYREICIDRLAGLIGELLGFMVEHFRYEENLMRLLPSTPEALRHIREHKRAHAEVSTQLSALTFSLDEGDPLACAHRLQKVVEHWLGAHGQSHDQRLVGALEAAFGHEVDYDLELVRLMVDAA